MDVVAVNPDGQVTQILVKPAHATLRHTWGIALWTPRFTEFMHSRLTREPAPTQRAELHVGDLIQAAIADGIQVAGIAVSERPFLDIGLPEQLTRAVATPPND